MPSLLYVAIMAKPINIAENDITAFDPYLLLKTTGSSWYHIADEIASSYEAYLKIVKIQPNLHISYMEGLANTPKRPKPWTTSAVKNPKKAIIHL